MIDFGYKPNDRRNFVHKRIGGALKSFVTSGFSPTAAAAGFVAGGRTSQQLLPVRRPVPRSLVARPSASGAASKEFGRALKLGPMGTSRTLSLRAPSGCPPLMKPNPVTGKCEFFLGDRPGRDSAPLQIGPGTGVGDAVMGRYGAGLEPGSRIIDRAICLRGMVLGNDDICYNRKQIRNSDRMWPRGRRPLLTGGDMRAISIASRAASRLTRTAVRLQEIGLIKKPVARKRPKKKN